MFSEITRMRPACARRPEVAIPIERVKSLTLSSAIVYSPSTLADRGLQQMQALAVERGHGRIIHLVGGGLHHLLFQPHRMACRPRLEAGAAVDVEPLAAARRRNRGARNGRHHRE